MNIFAKQAFLPQTSDWQKHVLVSLNAQAILAVRQIHDDELASVQATADICCEFLIPNYVDLQVNGGGGILFAENTTPSDLKKVVEVHAKYGTGALLPTLITHHQAAMENMADVVSSVLAEASSGLLEGGPVQGILGVHFEGPWLSPAKKGIHLAEHIRAPSDAELYCVTRKDLGKVMLTLAPETVSVDVIQDLVRQGVVVSIGHSNANVDQTLAALSAGATGFTHLYNAMSGLQGRDPGVLGAALGELDTFAGIIADGHHVSSYGLKLAYKTKGADKLVLVTDAMAHAGSTEAVLPYFTTEITRQGNRLTTPDGALAGSCLTMHEAMLYMHKSVGVALFESVKMASQTPLDWLQAPKFNAIQQGNQANFIALDAQFALQAQWHQGSKVT